MTKSITETILLESEKNLEKLRGILTNFNFEVESVLPQFPGSDTEVTAKIKVFTNPLSSDPEARKDYTYILHNYSVIPIHLAIRSRLPVVDNWVQIVLPSYNRKYVLADFAAALEPLGFNITDLEYYTLDALTTNRYTLRCKSNNPRFKDGVSFAVVEEIPVTAAPDINMYMDWDFKLSDNEFLMHSRNFLTYSFCFTKENSLVTKCNNDPEDPNIANAVVQIDRHAHFVEGIGLTKPKLRYHFTSFKVTRLTPQDIYAKFGFQTSMPLGIMADIRTSWELIDRMNELYDMGLTKSDVIDLRVHENLHGFRFKSSCLGYVGEIIVDIKGRVGNNR